jgi:hypothetical protein
MGATAASRRFTRGDAFIGAGRQLAIGAARSYNGTSLRVPKA